MLNLLRSSKLELRQSSIEMWMAIGLAVCMAAALIVLEETDAQQEITQLGSQMASIAAVHQPEVISEAEAANAQVELTRLKSRVNYLSSRQTERDDWNDVQAILLANHGSQKGLLAELQSLHWQHGKLEFEGLSEDPTKWQSLMNNMMLFDRWKTAPQILHAHRPLTHSSQSGISLVEVKVKANLWAQAANSPANPSAP
jgi:predicted MPP superfamily phosphohydrolase